MFATPPYNSGLSSLPRSSSLCHPHWVAHSFFIVLPARCSPFTTPLRSAVSQVALAVACPPFFVTEGGNFTFSTESSQYRTTPTDCSSPNSSAPLRRTRLVHFPLGCAFFISFFNREICEIRHFLCRIGAVVSKKNYLCLKLTTVISKSLYYGKN